MNLKKASFFHTQQYDVFFHLFDEALTFKG